MSETNIFEVATRSHLRFDSTRGGLTVEDLWDIPLTSKTSIICLDEIGKTIIRQLKVTEEESLVVKSSAANETLKLKLEIVKHIINVKLADAANAKNLKEKKETKEKILGILAEKKDEKLKSQSVEELEAMLSSL
jgi:hypothetical protein